MAIRVIYAFRLANNSNLFYSETVYLVQILHEMKNKILHCQNMLNMLLT